MLAQRADGRGRARARGRGQLLLGLRHVVERLGAGVGGLRATGARSCAAGAARGPRAGARAAAPAARAQAAALRALGEGLDDRRLVGILLLVDVDRQPLPQVLPPAASLVLGPRDRLPIGAAERRERRGDSARSPIASPMVGGEGAWIGKDPSCSFRK